MTRLVLPIRYCFSTEGPKLPGEDGYDANDPAPFDRDEWVYKRIQPENLEDIWRRSAYFTVDTSYALFRRAHWYRLEPVTKRYDPANELTWNSFSYSAPRFGGEARNIKVEISPPSVVLFDAESSLGWAKSEPLFQVGFLCLDYQLSTEKQSEVYTEEPNKIYLEDLLEFNERARCLWLPYKGYGEGYLAVMAGCRHLWPEGRAGDKEWKEFQKHFSETRDKKRLELRAAREKQDRMEAEAIADWFDRQWPPLGMWSAALHYGVRRDGSNEREWLTKKKEMREKTAAWAGGCAESACDKPCFPKEAQSVPKNAEAIESHTGWLAATDYRAFVWSYAYSNGSLSKRFGGPMDRPERYGHWIKFMNVDSVNGYWDEPAVEVEAKAKAVSAFEQDWARERTYARWANKGTYYGISPHSGSLLMSEKWSLPGQHFVTLYFDQVLLLLYLRVMAFQLSIRMAKLSAGVGDELARAKDAEKRNRIIRKHREPFRQIRQLFMSFGSLYQFPLLSTQQQSVEMYTIFRRHLDIDDLYKDISTEIDTWDRVVAQHDQERLTRVGLVLTRIGLPIAFLTLVLTWPGAWDLLSRGIGVTPHPLNCLLATISKHGRWSGIVAIVSALIALCGIFVYLSRWYTRHIEKRNG